MMDSFWSRMQRLLDRRLRSAKTKLGSAVFDRIEGFYGPADADPALINASLPS